MIKSTFLISNGSEFYGPFKTVDHAEKWGDDHDEELGDWFVTDLNTPTWECDLGCDNDLMIPSGAHIEGCKALAD